MSIHQRAPYTAEQIERFAARFQGGASAQVIADEFAREFPGITRNSIIGILHRRGIKGVRKSAGGCHGTWTGKELQILRASWPRGVAIEIIAARLGCRHTEAAIRQKVQMLGLHRAHSHKQAQRPDSPRREPSQPKPPQEIIDTIIMDGAGKSIIDVRFAECRYPIGIDEEGSHRFCATPCQGDKPYCSGHCAICFASLASRNWVDKKLRYGMAAE